MAEYNCANDRVPERYKTKVHRAAPLALGGREYLAKIS